jgi:hypothetical protein
MIASNHTQYISSKTKNGITNQGCEFMTLCIHFKKRSCGAFQIPVVYARAAMRKQLTLVKLLSKMQDKIHKVELLI